MIRSTAAAAAGLVAAGALVACGSGNEVVRGTGPAPSRPTGGDEVVVQVMVAGGFVPVEAALTAVPSLTVLGDGTVVTQAPVAAIYPGPAIQPLQAATAPASEVDGLVRRAGDLGLLSGPLEFGRPPVADAPDTTVTIVAGGRTARHEVYALAEAGDRLPGGGPPGVGEREAANRRAVQDFLDAARALPPGDRPWPPPAIAVYGLGDHRPEPGLAQPQVAWPLPRPPAVGGALYPCTLVEGGDAAVLAAALARANSLTPWIVDGRARALAFRPVVPGQPGCPGS